MIACIMYSACPLHDTCLRMEGVFQYGMITLILSDLTTCIRVVPILYTIQVYTH